MTETTSVAETTLYGYAGRILRVNLTSGVITTEEPQPGFYRQYVGGRGFIVHTLLREVPAGADPLGPENRLVFAAGPITGVPLAGAGRNSVGAKSPLTGGYGEAEVGGYWGAELKHAGFDAIIVEGVAEKPVYLWVHDGQAELRDAAHLWGLDVADTHRRLGEELGDRRVRTAIIGPAGEKLVRFASVINDIAHTAGRTGTGAVMGSKNLKAIAARGRQSVPLADPAGVRALNEWYAEGIKSGEHATQYGTGIGMLGGSLSGNLPTRNFQDGGFPPVEKIDAQALCDAYGIGMDTCYACPRRCKKVIKIDEPWSVDPVYGGPEYETLGAFGSNCYVDDVRAIAKAHELCNRYGMDTLSCGGTIAFAMECFEKGLLTLEDTEGLDLSFGNAAAMVEMVERIARRQGLGDLLAEGSRIASQRIGRGAQEAAIHVKGLEVPMHEPRLKQGLGLHYSVHATGADHMSGVHDTGYSQPGRGLGEVEALGIIEPIPAGLGPSKVRLTYTAGLWRQLSNHLGFCVFIRFSAAQQQEALSAITGWKTSFWELMKAAERGMALMRIFNLREGFTSADDQLPKRFFTPQPTGGLAGVVVDPEELARAQKLYYGMLGWDEDGVPTEARLAELGIEWAGEYLCRSRPAG
jgi:aldehyde:ferredoxin oxidoreductase